jgi:AraC-like DNA-binding protein
MKEHVKQRMDSLEEFIRNSSEKTSIDSVIDASFYSYRHANRLFTALKGESIHSYSTKIRIQIAADYLKYSSKRIFDIAIDAGYESTAAFSKAFKKLYYQSPSAFRQENNLGHILKQRNVKEPSYVVKEFNAFKIYTHKVSIASTITYEELFHTTKRKIQTLSSPIDSWMLLWDEDPELSKTEESRYFIGVDSTCALKSTDDFEMITLQGKYAIFDTKDFKAFAYELWHTLAYLVLNLDHMQLREENYIEYFSKNSLEALHTFLPNQLAIPI